MIDGVVVKTLKVVPDERGRLMEILRCDDAVFARFGQCYCTTVLPGVVKAWHGHERQTDNFTVVSGMAKIVLYDARETSKTRGEVMELFAGVHNPILVHVPPRVFHGFTAIGPDEAIMINCPTEPYDRENPDEVRLPARGSDIPYDWGIRDR